MARSGFFGQPVQGELTVTRVRQYIIPVTPRDEPNVSVRRDRRSGQRFTLPPLLCPHNGTLCHFNLLPRRQLPEFSDSSYPSMATASESPYPSNNTEHVHVSTHDHGSVTGASSSANSCLQPFSGDAFVDLFIRRSLFTTCNLLRLYIYLYIICRYKL